MGIILEASHLTYGYDESSHAIEDLSIVSCRFPNIPVALS